MDIGVSKVAAAAIALASILVLTASVASADSIIIGRNTTSNAPTVYSRTAGGYCAKQVLAISLYVGNPGGVYNAHGSSLADVIAVHDNGTNINWCGFSIPPLAALPPNVVLDVFGDGGADVIWGGNGGGAARVSTIYANGYTGGPGQYGGEAIYAGPATAIWGGDSSGDGILLPRPGSHVYGLGGDDTFCTEVPNVFKTFGVAFIDGGNGYDIRFGPEPTVEQGIQESNTTGGNQCALTYLYIYNSVLSMLAQ